ncbi:ribonuclease 1-like protein, partial [Trifolium pratense]
MSMQWPAAYCRNKNNSCQGGMAQLGRFTTHGLWPSNSTWPKLETCDTIDSRAQNFDLKMISPTLISKLNISWPNLKGPPNLGFWQYEWKRHGICSYNSFNQTQYFQLAYDIWSRIKLVDILQKGGITPRVNDTFDPIKFVNAITAHSDARDR